MQAKEKITSLTEEKEALAKQISELRALTSSSVPNVDQAKPDYEAQMNALKAEKDQLIDELTTEKERLQLQIENLQNVSLFKLSFV